MKYLVLHNKDYELNTATATSFEFEAESLDEAKDKMLTIADSGHFSIFINKMEIYELCIKRYEDTEQGMKERDEQLKQESLQRIKDSSKDFTFKLALFAENLRYEYDTSLGDELDLIRYEIEDYVESL